jgi:phytoene/squalene synthetase
MNTNLFLDKYYGLLKKIDKIDDLCTHDEFYDTIHTQFFDHMAEYYNFITEYSDEVSGTRAIQAMHRLIRALKLPVKEFKIPERALHIFFKT